MRHMGSSKGFPFEAGSSETKISDRASWRVRQASVEEEPLDQLLLQLRKIVSGPTERVFEARMEEMLDILDEQVRNADFRMDKITGRVDDVAQVTEAVSKNMRQFDGRLAALGEELASGTRQLEDAITQQVSKSHEQLEDQIDSLRSMLLSAMSELESRFNKNVNKISTTVDEHIATGNVEKERQRENVLVAVEQRIAQWRAEIDDTRRDDMKEVATSMMDIGQRLMALRQM